MRKKQKRILKNAKYYPNAIDSEFGEIASQKEQDLFFGLQIAFIVDYQRLNKSLSII